MKVYKYRYGSKRDLESLKDDYFYAPHPSKLNDPFKNMFHIDEIQKQLSFLGNVGSISVTGIQDALNDHCNNIREKIGIYSLSKTATDELLWAYYADSHTGFSIEYDSEQLVELNTIAMSFEVEYQDAIPSLNLNNIINPDVMQFLQCTTGIKSKSWAHEEEFRIILDTFGKYSYDFRAVQAIYFGLRMVKVKEELSDENGKLPDFCAKISQEQVMEALQGRGIKYYQMELESNSYQFKYVELEDRYKDAAKYMDNLGFIDKSCIDYYSGGWDFPSEYFEKVAEIIAVEPYFYKLNAIHISADESIKRAQPVIFSGFYIAENSYRQIKRLYTLDEIDDLYKKLNK